MPYSKFQPQLGLKEHMLQGNRVSVLEAFLLFGVQNFRATLTGFKREGLLIKSERAPMAKVLRRINEHTVCQTPKELPIREIQVMEWWISN